MTEIYSYKDPIVAAYFSKVRDQLELSGSVGGQIEEIIANFNQGLDQDMHELFLRYSLRGDKIKSQIEVFRLAEKVTDLRIKQVFYEDIPLCPLTSSQSTFAEQFIRKNIEKKFHFKPSKLYVYNVESVKARGVYFLGPDHTNTEWNPEQIRWRSVKLR